MAEAVRALDAHAPAPAFDALGEPELVWLRARAPVAALERGEHWSHAVPAGSACVVLEGAVALIHTRSGEVLARVDAGALVPELSPGALPEGIALRAESPAVLGVVRLDALDHPVRLALERLIGRAAIEAVSARTARLGEAAHWRAMGTQALLSTLLLVCLYTVTLWAVLTVLGSAPVDSALVSVPLQALFLVETVRFIRNSELPWARFGFTLERARAASLEALAITAVLIPLTVAGKWLAHDRALPLFEGVSRLRALGPWASAALVAVYVVFSGVQEVVVRSGVQRGLELVLVGPHASRWALIVPSLLFGLMHLHLSGALAVATLTVSLVWGVLFRRHRSLVGVGLSHLLLGGFVFFVLGL